MCSVCHGVMDSEGVYIGCRALYSDEVLQNQGRGLDEINWKQALSTNTVCLWVRQCHKEGFVF
jgi:hypothetical protein